MVESKTTEFDLCLPIELVEAKTLDPSGKWHVYLQNSKGKKIAALWGGQDYKLALAKKICEALNA